MSDTAVLDRPAEAEAPTPPATAPTGPLADLILVRLLPPAKKPPTPNVIKKDLDPLFHTTPTAAQVAEVVKGLQTTGLVFQKERMLTDAGRARALGYLGIRELPAKVTWGTIKTKFLVPKALGVSAETVDKSDKLEAVLFKRKLGLPVGTANTMNAVLDAIACRILGFPDKPKLNFRDVILSKDIGETKPLSVADLKLALRARFLSPPKGRDGLRKLTLKGFADAANGPSAESGSLADVNNSTSIQRPEPQVDETFDLKDFANTVLSVARKSSTGRFGDNKVFINHVWRQLQDEPRFKRLGFDGFKAKLVEANTSRYLDLLPADLNQAFQSDDITQSATNHRHSTYHFISTGGGQ